MHGRPIRTSLGSEPYGSALVRTGPKCVSMSVSNDSMIVFMNACAQQQQLLRMYDSSAINSNSLFLIRIYIKSQSNFLF